MHPSQFKSKAILLALLSLAAFPAMSAETNPAAAGKAPLVVNGQVIPTDRLEQLAQERLPKGQAMTPDIRKKLEEDLITGAILAQEATKQGLDHTPAVTNDLLYARENILAHAYIEQQLKARPVADKEARAEYDRLKTQLGDKEYKVAHILVKTDKEAKDLINKLNKGGSFSKLAKQYSLDQGSRGNGGELDWVNPHMLVEPVADALPKLAKGKISQSPVHSQFGYHILRLEDIRALHVPDFEAVKPRLVQSLQQVALKRQVARLRAEAKVTGQLP